MGEGSWQCSQKHFFLANCYYPITIPVINNNDNILSVHSYCENGIVLVGLRIIIPPIVKTVENVRFSNGLIEI